MKKGTTMKRIPLPALVAALFSIPALALAQPAPPADAPPVVLSQFHIAAAEDARAQAQAWKRWSEDFTRDMRTSMGTLFSGRMASGRIVKGAPYSAEVITEMNQPLADGNVISKQNSGRVYRDGEGRSRQDSGAPGETSVYINDPVAGQYVVLNPGAKRATVKTGGHFGTHSAQSIKVDGTEEVRVEDGKVFLNGKEVGLYENGVTAYGLDISNDVKFGEDNVASGMPKYRVFEVL
jgi:hypothetical protein